MDDAVPSNVEDLRGRVFGRLTVVGYEGVRRHGKRPYHYWICRCSCSPSVDFPAKGESLRGGNTKSCGCLKEETKCAMATLRRKHGRSGSKEFHTWGQMIQRCRNPRHPRYSDWGGRGIAVCPRWRESFAAFLEDMGEAPTPKHTIDRIDNDRGYEPGNCRWATTAEQNRNSRKNRILTYQGRSMILADWAREIGIDPAVLQTRLRRGWTVEQAIGTPHSGYGGSPDRGRAALQVQSGREPEV
jgi:hypothetical protein